MRLETTTSDAPTESKGVHSMKTKGQLIALLAASVFLQAFAHNVNAQDTTVYQRLVEAMHLSQQAEVLYNAGRLDEALPLAERAVALQGDNPVLSDGRYSLRSSPYSILGRLYRAQGDYVRAEATYLRLLKTMETPPGSLASMSVARAYNELAAVYEAKGDYAKALQSRVRGNELIEHNLVKTLAPALSTTGEDTWENRSTLSSAQMSAWEYIWETLLDSLVRETNSAVSLSALHLPEDRQARQLALTTILQRKGRLLDARAGQIAVLRRYGNQQDQNLIDQLTKVYMQGSTSSIGNSASAKKKVDELTKALRENRPTAQIQAELQAEIMLSMMGPKGFTTNMNSQKEIEGAISKRSAELRKPEPLITISSVAQALPADAALVEFVSYKPFTPKARLESEEFGPSRYGAYVLHSVGVPQWIELGDTSVIDEAMNRLVLALRDPGRTDVDELARALDEQVMRPVRKLLGPSRRVFIAPDGALNLLPFSVLRDEKNQYLIENYSIDYLASGRDLLRLQNRGESRQGVRVFANPLFDLSPKQINNAGPSANNETANVVFKDLMSRDFKLLPGTAAEATAIANLFPDAVLSTEVKATEASIKSVNRPRVLHIATHGFFLEDTKPRGQPNRLLRDDGLTNNSSVGIGQLLNSGLIFTGIRQGTSGPGEDGVLTALEVVGLDLWGTRLVVLSACETGLGSVKNGEGVYGLRRALVLAGSETQVMSLWKVSDAGTRDLMVAYFTLLQQGENRVDALRKVQNGMLRGEILPGSGKVNRRDTKDTDSPASDLVTTKNYRHPFYWASFITSGDWRNLDGKEAPAR